MIKLRFIGVDGTYGLKKNEVYEVDMRSEERRVGKEC